MRTYKPKRPGEIVTASVNFAPEIPYGESIATAEAWSVSVYSGTDPNPSAVLSGAPVKLGAAVSHNLAGGVSGVIYLIVAKVTLTDGQKLEIPVLLPVADLF